MRACACVCAERRSFEKTFSFQCSIGWWWCCCCCWQRWWWWWRCFFVVCVFCGLPRQFSLADTQTQRYIYRYPLMCSYLPILVRAPTKKKPIAFFNHDRKRERVRHERKKTTTYWMVKAAAARFTCFCININVTAARTLSIWRMEQQQGKGDDGGRVELHSHRYLRYWLVVNPSVSNETNGGHSRESNRFTHQTYLYENKCQMRNEKCLAVVSSFANTRHSPETLDPLSTLFFSAVFHIVSAHEIETDTHSSSSVTQTKSKQREMVAERDSEKLAHTHERHTEQPFKSYSGVL